MIADRAKAMMAAGGDFPELEARGAYSGEWKSLPERRITFHFYTERDDEFLDFGSFCMKCGGRPLVEGALDFYPWHLLGVAAFFYTVDKKGGAELLFYDPGCWCDVVYLEPVAGTGKMVLTGVDLRLRCGWFKSHGCSRILVSARMVCFAAVLSRPART